jgi:hypothetical protein
MNITVEEFLRTMPEDVREDMCEFLYSRIPYRFTAQVGTALKDTHLPLPTPSLLSRAQQV